MRKKNVLIAIFFITIVLLVPFTSVTGAIDNKLVKVTKEQENLSSIPYGFSFEDLRAIINKINLLFRNYPEVTEICNNITKILYAPYPILCTIFRILSVALLTLSCTVDEIFRILGLTESLIGIITEFVFLGLYGWAYLNLWYFCYDFSSILITGLSLIKLKIVKIISNSIICKDCL